MKWYSNIICIVFVVLSFSHFLSARRRKKRHSCAINSLSLSKKESYAFSHVELSDKELQLFDKNNALSHKKKKQSISFQLISSIDVQEAKLSDIPVPLHAKRLIDTQKQSNGDIMLRYDIHMQSNEIKQFYLQHMEWLGWQHTHSFENIELLLLFKKPHRSCALSIRPQKKQTDLVIFVSCD